ncbi:hypothetical protein SAMN05444320_106437 [Streptoalloteichus hindustanus]|uniref:Uncharacterized protein n=1 Tax=Streptoalloteichus hindustanus TaxID=2017 RepID=A0A1M5H7Y4_STRHI|nr:hypothetical protein SAMN05444320_106437 [Streptoalloteichus hindustanus]
MVSLGRLSMPDFELVLLGVHTLSVSDVHCR